MIRPDTVRKRLAENGVEIRDKVSSTASSWPEWAIYYYMQKAFPELQGGVLMYTLDDHKYPFPDEITANGGSFYVKADQHATIRFESKNRGIQIK